MNVFLLFKAKNFNLNQELLWNEQFLTQDLELKILFESMALNDNFLAEVVRKVILSNESCDRETILYRQEILNDCLKNPDVVRKIFEYASDALLQEKNNYWGFLRNSPHSVLFRSVEVLEMFVEMLEKLKKLTDQQSANFTSKGFSRFFNMLKTELSDEYFEEIKKHLTALKFRRGVLISARLGKGNKGINYTLRKIPAEKLTWWRYFMRLLKKVFRAKDQGGIVNDSEGNILSYTFFISSRDEGGIRSLGELKDEGINLLANSLAQADDHIHAFFSSLRIELAFYLGCLNLYRTLASLNEPVVFPALVSSQKSAMHFRDLYDICLALTTQKTVIGNDCNVTGKKLIIITGANQGGKSTFLRSIGLAHLMLRCGMFVPASSFKANLYDSIITHFRREEDAGMKSGKLDEELERMDQVVENLGANAMILFNESFGTTNEREGAEIARQIVSALLEYGVTVYYVTHLYEFARIFYKDNRNNSLFLQAGRQMDGMRTFKITEGAPLQTSYGYDLYREVFAEES